MGKIEDLELFVQVVDAGSLTKGAAALGIAKSAVSRRLSLLEQRFNTKLIDRDPGKWVLTSRGAELYARAHNIVGDVACLNADFLDTRLALQGPLTLSLPRDFGLGYLSGPIQKFMRLYPGIELRLGFDDRLIDLRHENFDAALRITPEMPMDVSAEKLTQSRAYVCASPAYLLEAPVLKQPADLKNHIFLGYGLNQQHHLSLGGKQVAVRPTYATNSGTEMVSWATAGFGIAALPDFLCQPAVDAGHLKIMLPDHPLPDLGVFLCTVKNAAPNRRVSLFAEFIRGVLAD